MQRRHLCMTHLTEYAGAFYNLKGQSQEIWEAVGDMDSRWAAFGFKVLRSGVPVNILIDSLCVFYTFSVAPQNDWSWSCDYRQGTVIGPQEPQ